MRTGYAAGLALASGGLYALAQEPAGAWGFAFVCLAPLLVALRGRGLRARFGLGWLAGATAALCATGSTAHALGAYFDLSPWLAWPLAWGAAQLLAGSAFALFAVLAGDPLRAGVAVTSVRACTAFVAAELLRARLFAGGGWLLLGHALAPVPELAQLAALGGTALVSAWLVLSSVAVSEACGARRRAALGAFAVVALAGATSWVSMPPAGAVRVASGAASADPDALRIALVQSGVPNAWASDPTRLRPVLSRLVDLSRHTDPLDLVVWPENAYPVALPANARPLERARRTLVDVRHLLVGAPRFDPDRPEHRYTSALLLDAQGRTEAQHDKARLVPFTESWPAALAPLDPGGADLSHGATPTPLAVGEAKIGVLICYELLFADLAARLVDDGAGLLLNLSNDSWFTGSAGADQQLAVAVLRAIELRRPVLRSTTTGVTAAIDPAGRVIARLPDGEPGVLHIDARPTRTPSTYARLRNGLVLALLALTAPAVTRRRSR